jgi:hypothetical protein
MIANEKCSRQDHVALINGLLLQTEVREMVWGRNAMRLFHLNRLP